MGGIPTNLTRSDAWDEILKLLELIWRQDGWTFKASQDLHAWDQGKGIVVLPPRGGNEASDSHEGMAEVKFTNSCNARFIIQQAGSRLRIEGTVLKAGWAKPKD